VFGYIDVGTGAKNVILNLHGVSQIDAAGTGELTLLLTCARTAGRQAALLNLSASAIDPTDVFQLVADFEAFES
jgi:anti-anti-sigma regulatory factor